MEVSTELLVNLDQSLSECGIFNIDIRELTIAQIQEHYKTGKLTSVDLTKCYLNRISKIDVHLRSVIQVNPDAISLAKRADKERSAGLNKSLLHGIPILIKDNIGTADLMQTTAGALALENVKPKEDSDVVKRLRKVGAIILGKANLSEWAWFRDDQIPSGWSGRGGQTVSPYVMGNDPLGSSTGSAVSVSANLAMISLGTETNGSIIAPSLKAAIVGLKPTVSSVSSRGVIPLSFSFDVVGPMARSVADVAILLGVISEIDLQGCDVDISSSLPNQHFKIAVLRDPPDPSMESVMSDFETCLDTLKRTSMVKVIDLVESPQYMDKESFDKQDLILTHEFKHSLNKYLRHDVELHETIRTLTDIVEFNEINPPVERYKQNLLELSDKTDGLDNEKYLATREECRSNAIQYLESLFDKNQVDALVASSFSKTFNSLYSLGACGGYPTITIPIGILDGDMPFSVLLLGRKNSEALLLKLAYFVELSRPNTRPVPCFRKVQSNKVN